MTTPPRRPGKGSEPPSVPTIVTVLGERARDHPEKLFLRFREAGFGYAAFERRTRSLASGLRHLGVAGIVPTLLPNCADAVALWFAANRAGAVWAPLNTGFRGRGLAHAINLTGSRDLVVDQSLLDAVLETGDRLEHLERLFVRGRDDRAHGTLSGGGRSFAALPLKALALEDDGAPATPPPSEAAPSLLIYTSGTTGVSKACELSHRYVMAQAGLLSRAMGMSGADVLFCPYPVFHWDATIGTVAPALRLGATAVITERFSVSRFWEDVRRYGVTVFDFMGATLTFLYKQDPRADDADNPARLGWGVPMPAFQADFEARFGVTLVEGYGSTEGGVMVFQEPGAVPSPPPGSCGRCVPEYRLRIVDDAGDSVTTGDIGEIVARPAATADRHIMMTRYHGMPEVNRDAFRGGWFHTGDLGRLDDEGNLYFEGRKKDAIRRRGENISAFEIEQVIEAHPAVLEVAAYGVPSEFTEEDVAVAVALKPGCDLDAGDLRDYCRGRMALYMVPTQVRFLDALPKTPTEKVAKRVLKAWHARANRGVAGDRAAAPVPRKHVPPDGPNG